MRRWLVRRRRCVVDVFCADEAEDSGEEGGGHDEECCGEGGVRVGEAQPVPAACRGRVESGLRSGVDKWVLRLSAGV